MGMVAKGWPAGVSFGLVLALVVVIPAAAQQLDAFSGATVPVSEEASQAQFAAWIPVIAAALTVVLQGWGAGEVDGLEEAVPQMLIEQAEARGRMLTLLEQQTVILNDMSRTLNDMSRALARIEARQEDGP